MRHRVILALFMVVVTMPSATARVAVEDVGFDQRLNETVPLDLVFQDEQNQRVRLGRYVDAKPVILVLAYYRCPNLCGLVLDGLAESLEKLPFRAGETFEVIAVSIAPEETPEIAAAKKTELGARYPDADVESWHFLTGDEAAIRGLARAIGFRYAYDPEIEQYAHAAGVTLLTGEGRIARYIFGVRFPPHDLRLGLVEAAAGRIGSPLDQLWLLCYGYDPSTGRYSLLIMNVIRLAGAATVFLLGAYLGLLVFREKRKRRL